MLLTSICPEEWDYSKLANYPNDLVPSVEKILTDIRTDKGIIPPFLADSRPVHNCFFSKFTQTGFEYFAGHYRGEEFICLKNYNVGIPGDPRVGTPAHEVAAKMADFAKKVNLSLTKIKCLPLNISRKEKLKFGVKISGILFVEFLTIHPYANGNGHIARFFVWAILGYFEFWPENGIWTIEPRPSNIHYSEYVKTHRDGKTQPLERLILESYLRN